MKDRLLKIGVSACVFPPDPERNIFKGKRLLYVEESYVHWMMSHGIMPVMIPTFAHGLEAGDLLAQVDGLMLQGGSDVAPTSYGETALRPEWEGDAFRDAYEIKLVRESIKRNIPLLGICRGCQLINVALGGTLFQDINEQNPDTRVHRDADVYDNLEHEIKIKPGSGLANIYPGHSIVRVNSIHHQAIKDLGENLVVEARSEEDGIIEAVRHVNTDAGSGDDSPENPYIVGVQWHPEFQDPRQDQNLLDCSPILQEFMDAAAARRAQDRVY